MDYPYSDQALSRRLERCEAKTNAAMVAARAVLHPELETTWIERGGTYAMYDGAGSPLTQTFGLGLFGMPAEEDLDALEEFFGTRGAPVFHEVSPLAHPETLVLLSRRGYRPVELTTILYRPVVALQRTSEVRTRIIEPGEEDLWSATSAEGWSEYPELGDFMHDLGRVTAMSRGTHAFLAELDGRAVATGALAMHDGVAILAGASTIPSERKRGAQRALLEARLQYAFEQGCDLATMGAQPGSASQRNAEWQGFRIAYTRIKWGKM
ncbi:MAG TPA: GNAT family N-acetyltransferase [Thermoanaerobaculia bacterium]|jgi:GNAT superfamily N-acetyltransferase|nr:GNAT family N-acetyltransferase [Thermoanaerobaculia bacterium]